MTEQRFKQVTSAVPGITVFAPVSAEPEAVPVTFTCPKCGGRLGYDLKSSGIACEYCGYQAPVSTTQVGTRAGKFEFTLETLQAAEAGWGEMRNQLHCDNCGAELSYPKGAVAAACPYCASNKVNVTLSERKELRPQVLVPFAIKPDGLQAIISEWFSQGWLHPGKLAQSAALRKFVPFYLPYWTFSADFEADWKAQVAHVVTETYWDPGSKSHRTRTRTEWRWESGSIDDQVQNLLVCGVNPSRLNWNLLKEIEPYDLRGLVKFQPELLAGMNAQAYDLPLVEAWDKGKGEIRDLAVEQAISGKTVRNLSIDLIYDNEKWRYIFLPVFIAVYRFNEKTYQVMVNGQSGKVSGQKPIDWTKAWLVILACLLPGFLTMAIGLITSVIGVGFPVLFVGIVLLIIGMVSAFFIYKEADRWENK